MPYVARETIAGGSVSAAGVLTGRGCAITHVGGTGIYLITTDQQIDPTQKIIKVTGADAAGALPQVTVDADAAVTVTMFSLPAALGAGPVAADLAFYFEILKMNLI